MKLRRMLVLDTNILCNHSDRMADLILSRSEKSPRHRRNNCNNRHHHQMQYDDVYVYDRLSRISHRTCSLFLVMTGAAISQGMTM
jgi:hypothetical protein